MREMLVIRQKLMFLDTEIINLYYDMKVLTGVCSFAKTYFITTSLRYAKQQDQNIRIIGNYAY